MSKRNDPVGRARSRTAPVKKPFPLGFVLGSAVLVIALVGILVYAVQNQGVGDTSSLKYAESQIDGLEVEHDLARNHVDGAVQYPGAASVPPTGGDHNTDAQSCQVYTETIPNQRAIHALEHGAVWVTYDPKALSSKDLEKLTEKVEGNPYRMLSPYPGLKQKIALQAWGEQVFVDSVDDKRVDRFLDLFTNGPQTPEKGAACTGSSSTGPVGTTPIPGQSTMPSSAQPSASPTAS